jgi:hypothetical protein
MGRDPDFVIAGAMRSGTTSLHHWLRAHPGVWMPERKEIHYFDLNYDRGRTWYQDQFTGCHPGQVLGESTPEYIFLPWARERMCRDLPRARLIVSLRDPVDRAWSHFCMLRHRGREDLTFERALDVEPTRLRDRSTWSRYGYAAKGDYAAQLEDLFGRQGRDKVLVLIFERDLVARPADTFERICGFVGVDGTKQTHVVGSRVNAAIRLRSRFLRRMSVRLPTKVRDAVGHLNAVQTENDPLPPKVEARLVDRFAESNQALERLLGYQIPEWRGDRLAPRAQGGGS